MKLLKRFSIAILIALIVTAATYIFAQAGTEPGVPAQQEQPTIQMQSSDEQPSEQQIECSVCHSKFTDPLQASKHGHAISDPLFNQMWTDQGKPGACLVCHVTGYDPALGTWEEDGVSCEA